MKMFIERLVKSNSNNIEFFICEKENIQTLYNKEVDPKKIHKILFSNDLQIINFNFKPFEKKLIIDIIRIDNVYSIKLDFANPEKFYDYLKENKNYFDLEKVNFNFLIKGSDL